MNTTVICPTCGAELELHDFSVGEVVECPGCNQSFIPELPEINENEEQIVAPVGILKRKPIRIPKDSIPTQTIPSRDNTEQIELLRKLVFYARLWTIIFIYIPLISGIITLIIKCIFLINKEWI